MVKEGSRIGEIFQLGQPIGTGGSAVVYAATDLRSGKQVAIKIDQGKDPSTRDRLRHEAFILNQIRHQNVVALIDWKDLPNQAVYLVMERLEGCTINQIIPQNIGLPFRSVWPILQQILDGISAVHAKNIVHLDLKPSNIFLAVLEEHHTQVKILDFSIAKMVGEKMDGHPVGTPGFVSPEHILGNCAADPRADIYALGALLAFFLTGQRPYHGQKPEQILAKQLAEAPETLDVSYLGQSKDLQGIVLKAMHRDPEERYKNVAAFKAALNSIRWSSG